MEVQTELLQPPKMWKHKETSQHLSGNKAWNNSAEMSE